MLRRPAVARRGPGLIGTVARTAVIAGTATAVTGRVSGRQQRKAQADAEHDAAQQAANEPGGASEQGTAERRAPEVTPGGGDLTTRLRQLADLRAAGALSEEEFAAAKAKLLG